MRSTENSHKNRQQRRRDPTPKQIRERCRRIREEWSENTLRQRAGEVEEAWTVPTTRVFGSKVVGYSEK